MLATLLAAPGADPNARLRAPGCAFDGATALHCVAASYESREEHVRLLVAAGADVNATLPCGLTAMDVANHASTRALLSSHGGRYAPYETTAARSTFRTTLRLLVALQGNDFGEMRNAIAAGADVNATDILGNAALHQAVLQKSASDIVWLLKSGANIDAQLWNGDSPLHAAVLARHLPTLELLLAAGADPSIENSYGTCPARLAARLSDAVAWRAITTHVAARSGGTERVRTQITTPGEPQMPRRGRAARPKPHPAAPSVSEEELQRRAAAAEAAAAELIAGEAAEKAQRARKELQRMKRRLKKQQAQLQKLEEEAGELVDDEEGDGGQQRASSPDEDILDEPDWIARLL
jgi:hypothetical protein